MMMVVMRMCEHNPTCVDHTRNEHEKRKKEVDEKV